jgi:nucleotide-binding universal stress UspA family protein
MSELTYRQVLVPLDGSEAAETALPHAIAVASRFRSTLTLVHAAETARARVVPPSGTTRLTESEQEVGQAYLENVAARCALGSTAVLTVQLAGSPADVIVQHAGRADVDLIVMSTRGRSGFERLLLGRVADEVRRRAPCPMLIVPTRAPRMQERQPTYRWILLALDGSRDGERALPHAVAIARRFRASVAVVRAVAPASVAGLSRGPGPHPCVLVADECFRAAAYIAGVANQLARSGLQVRSEPIEGAAEDVLARRARSLPADVVVLAKPERSWIERLVVGSVTNGVLRRAVCPVLIVPTHTNDTSRA